VTPDKGIATAAMIAQARAAGLTWAQIGSVINDGNRNPKLAKKRARAIARAANRDAARMISEEAARA
jgi:hypothetical protein